MLIFDAHLDLAMNALEWNRDLTGELAQIRAGEAGMTDTPDRGRSTVCFPEMRRGGIGLCVATQIARYVKDGNPLPGWHSPAQAWAQTQGQLAWYRAMQEAGLLRQINDASQLEEHLARWEATSSEPSRGEQIGRSGPTPLTKAGTPAGPAPIGFILSLEGADSILTPGHLQRAYEQGL